MAANEEAISIQPAFTPHLNVPNVALVPIADDGATWDLFVVWQPGDCRPTKSVAHAATLEVSLSKNLARTGGCRLPDRA